MFSSFAYYSRSLIMMKRHLQVTLWGSIVWLCLSLASALAISSYTVYQQSNQFTAQSNIAYRLLSQRLAQHDVILNMLSILQAPLTNTEQLGLLKTMFPQIVDIYYKSVDHDWPVDTWADNEAQSRQLKRAVLADVDLDHASYILILAAQPYSYALKINLSVLLPLQDWPFESADTDVSVQLSWQRQTWDISTQTEPLQGVRTFVLSKTIASLSQPFTLRTTRDLPYSALPWLLMLGMALLNALLVGVFLYIRSQREQNIRSKELLRLGQITKLNSMGELAAGVAHELNQPLTSVLANTQASIRLLAEDPPDLDAARQAMQQTSEQVRRAATVLKRLRTSLEEKTLLQQSQAVAMQQVINDTLYLLGPELDQLHIKVSCHFPSAPVYAKGDNIALGQIVQNLLSNAMHSLSSSSPPRHITLRLQATEQQIDFYVQDNGAGIEPSHLSRIFEPFFSTRSAGLGLGLSLCESLAQAMDGSLSATNSPSGGAVFNLSLRRFAAEE